MKVEKSRETTLIQGYESAIPKRTIAVQENGR
jgi:hypothetical protein